MLQFSATLYTTTARLTPRSSWRFAALIANNSSTAVTSEHSAASAKEDDTTKFAEIQNISQKEKQQSKKAGIRTKFYTLSEKRWSSESDTIFSKKFQAAKSINDLLDLALLQNLSVNNALKLISSITNQINSGKSQLANIETDKRFIHLRKIVKDGSEIRTSDDLSQYSDLSTPAMIEVMTALREQGKRHTPLLRMLSYNIVKYNITLSMKQSAALLYSMAILNFPDKILLEKITSDLLKCIPKGTNVGTNRSILTSLGFLRYKNEEVLNAFCNTFFKESINYKFHDYSSILQTFAALQYKSESASSLIKNFTEQLDPFYTSAAEWLDIVWALAVLDAIRPRHIEFVLDPTFMERLIGSSKLSVSKKLKLLNINAIAQYVLKDYKGSFLDKDSEVFNVPLNRAKEKQVYIDALLETLTKLLPSQSYFKTDLNTNMGFLLDAECRIDDQNKFINVEDWNEQSKNVKRIAIMVHDYHDYCRGQKDLVGSTYLYTQLLKARGYHLITISYENFSIQDKIDKRINYLKQCMNNAQKIKFI